MSLLDQVRKLEAQVVQRLKELEPLIGEYNQLRKLAERLGVRYTAAEEDSADTATPARRRAPAKKSTRARGAAAKTRTTRRTPAKTAAKRADRPPAGSARSAGKASATGKAPEAGTQAKTGARRSRGRKGAVARPGQRSDDVLRVVAEHPGSTVREIGERLGVDATGLYRVANKLTEDGRLRKDGPRLYAVESGAGAEPDTADERATPASAETSAQRDTATGANGDTSPDGEATSSE